MSNLLQRRSIRILLYTLVLVASFLALSALMLAVRFTADLPVTYADPAEHFKYGSTGGERESGFPYWVFKVMPRVCAKHLPGKGFESLGFVYEEGRDLPVGMSKRRHLGIDRTFLNCAVCHTSTVRESATAPQRVIVGMPANGFDLFKLQEFLFACADDANFSREVIVPEIAREMSEHGQSLSLLDRYLVYPVAVWLMRERLLMLRGRFAPMLEHTPWGPGRTDTFNPNKALFNFPLDKLPEKERNAAVDFPSIWLQKPRQGMQLHWDGNNVMTEERNKNAAFGTGTTPPTIDLDAIRRIEVWLETAEPPKFPGAVDATLAKQGEPIYAQYCSSCHGKNGREFSPPHNDSSRDCLAKGTSEADLYGPYVGRVTRIEQIGTDPHRIDSFSYQLAATLGTVYAGYEHRYCHYRKTFGYANAPLDGVWLRAPYLHNGSVPTLRDLLEPAAARPARFYRGNDVYDATRMGFVSDVAALGERRFFLYDVTLPGNSNAGHEGPEFGTSLAATEKDALVEYLKTF